MFVWVIVGASAHESLARRETVVVGTVVPICVWRFTHLAL